MTISLSRYRNAGDTKHPFRVNCRSHTRETLSRPERSRIMDGRRRPHALYQRNGHRMPVAANPRRRDYYVYQFKVDSYPFYVGIGRDKRGPDRLRYVRSLLTPRNRAKLQRSCLQVRVIAELLRERKDIRYSQTRKPLTRAGALEREKKDIARLIRQGFRLTNRQQNPYRHLDAGRAVRTILMGERVSNGRHDLPSVSGHRPSPIYMTLPKMIHQRAAQPSARCGVSSRCT